MQLSIHFRKGFLPVRGTDVTRKGVSASLDVKRSCNHLLKISNYLETCPTRLPGAQSASELPSGAIEAEHLQQHSVQKKSRKMNWLGRV